MSAPTIPRRLPRHLPRPIRRIAEALTSPHSLDDFTSAFNPRWTGSLTGTITSISPLTPNAAQITISVPRSWPGHHAGQYVSVGVEIDGRRQQRTYSITGPSSRPGAGTITLGVQRVEGGLVSNHLIDAARPSTLVHLGTPTGEFVLPDRGSPADESNTTPLLLLGAGSGMTPIRSIIAELEVRHDRGEAVPDVVALSFAPDASSRMFHHDLVAAAQHPWLRVEFVDTRSGGAASATTRLSPALLDKHCADWSQRRVYACGPEGFLDAATDAFAARGIVGDALDEQLVIERFTRVLPPRDGHAETASVVVELADSATRLELRTDTPLLDSIEAAGQLAPSGCRNGICHTCSTEVIDGCALNLRDGRIVEAGQHVQLCISAPLTDLTLAL